MREPEPNSGRGRRVAALWSMLTGTGGRHSAGRDPVYGAALDLAAERVA